MSKLSIIILSFLIISCSNHKRIESSITTKTEMVYCNPPNTPTDFITKTGSLSSVLTLKEVDGIEYSLISTENYKKMAEDNKVILERAVQIKEWVKFVKDNCLKPE